MADKIKVILIESFEGQRYVLRYKKDYVKTLSTLLERLLGNERVGSIACISVRYIDRDKYNEIVMSPESVRLKKGLNDG